MRGVFLDKSTMKPEELDFTLLENSVDEWSYYSRSTPEEVNQRIVDADVVVVNKTLVTADQMDLAPNLKLICVTATGTNNIDLEAAGERNIAVCNVVGYATGSVVQHTIALILGLVTNWHRYHDDCMSGAWAKSDMFCLLDYPVVEVEGKTLGIIGYGSLGRRVAAVAEAMGMKVQVAQSLSSEAVEGRLALDELYKSSDVISIHCPLTDESRNLVNADVFRKMKPGAFLVNVSRGGIVNEMDLLEALQNGRIAGAALDVLEQEPPPADHPLLNSGLGNLIVTPHSAWISTECRQRLLDGVAHNIKNFFAGKPTNKVNP